MLLGHDALFEPEHSQPKIFLTTAPNPDISMQLERTEVVVSCTDRASPVMAPA